MRQKKQPSPKGVEYAYKNEPGTPIVRNGCSFCGLLGNHTPTCPLNGIAPKPVRTPLDPIE